MLNVEEKNRRLEMLLGRVRQNRGRIDDRLAGVDSPYTTTVQMDEAAAESADGPTSLPSPIEPPPLRESSVFQSPVSATPIAETVVPAETPSETAILDRSEPPLTPKPPEPVSVEADVPSRPMPKTVEAAAPEPEPEPAPRIESARQFEPVLETNADVVAIIGEHRNEWTLKAVFDRAFALGNRKIRS